LHLSNFGLPTPLFPGRQVVRFKLILRDISLRIFFLNGVRFDMREGRPGVGNLSLAAGQKQTLHGLAGRTKFPRTTSFSSLFMVLIKLANLCNFDQFNSWFSQFKLKHKIRHAVHF